jgi:hypothetical protein
MPHLGKVAINLLDSIEIPFLLGADLNADIVMITTAMSNLPSDIAH